MKRGRSKKKIINQPTDIHDLPLDELNDEVNMHWRAYGPHARNNHSKHFDDKTPTSWFEIRYRYLNKVPKRRGFSH